MARKRLKTDFGLEVEGIDEMIRALRKLSRGAQRRVIRRAMQRATRHVLKVARANVPVAHGHLKRSLRTKTIVVRGGVIVGMVGPSRKYVATVPGRHGTPKRVRPSRYAHLVEFGTAPHAVKLPGGGVGQHPGTPPAAFMRRAIESSRGAVLTIMRDTFREGLATGGRRLSAGRPRG